MIPSTNFIYTFSLILVMKPTDIHIMSLFVYSCEERKNVPRLSSWRCLGYNLYMHYIGVLLSLVLMHARMHACTHACMHACKHACMHLTVIKSTNPCLELASVHVTTSVNNTLHAPGNKLNTFEWNLCRICLNNQPRPGPNETSLYASAHEVLI